MFTWFVVQLLLNIASCDAMMYPARDLGSLLSSQLNSQQENEFDWQFEPESDFINTQTLPETTTTPASEQPNIFPSHFPQTSHPLQGLNELPDSFRFTEQQELNHETLPDSRKKIRVCSICQLWVNQTELELARIHYAEIIAQGILYKGLMQIRQTELNMSNRLKESIGKPLLFPIIPMPNLAGPLDWYPLQLLRTFSICLNERSNAFIEALAFGVVGNWGNHINCTHSFETIYSDYHEVNTNLTHDYFTEF